VTCPIPPPLNLAHQSIDDYGDGTAHHSTAQTQSVGDEVHIQPMDTASVREGTSPDPRPVRRSPRRVRAAATSAALLVVALNAVFPRSIDWSDGPLPPWSILLDVSLMIVVVLISTSIGAGIVRRLGGAEATGLESLSFSLAIGFGILAYSLFLFALLGQLNRGVVTLLLFAGIVAGRTRLLCLPAAMVASISTAVRKPAGLAKWKLAVALIWLGMFLLSLSRSLTPAWDYDALMYHIATPMFLISGNSLAQIGDRWFAAYPQTMELVFAIGVAFGSTSFAKLVTLTFSTLLVASMVACARRVVGSGAGWMSIALWLTFPILPIWASMANVDFGWAAFELLALLGVLLWDRSRSRGTLVLAGLMSGLALGSKYFGVLGLLSVSASLFFLDWRRERRGMARTLLAVWAPAVLVALPWYAKNLLLYSDPLFPFLGGGMRVSPSRMSFLQSYFETSRQTSSFIKWVTLPVRIYTEVARFDEVTGGAGTPSPILPLVLIYAFVKRNRLVSALLIYAACHFALASLAPFGTRYLLPVFPPLCVAIEYCIRQLVPEQRSAVLARPVVVSALVASVLMAAAIQLGILLREGPYPVLIGREDPRSYISRLVPTHRALSFAKEHIQNPGGLLSTGDGRMLYCGETCVNSDDQFFWVTTLEESSSPRDYVERLNRIGVTHLLLSVPDLRYFTASGHDPQGKIAQAWAMLQDGVFPACGRLLYSDEAASLYELDCEADS